MSYNNNARKGFYNPKRDDKKRQYVKRFDGDNANHVYEEPKSHLPKKFQNRKVEKSTTVEEVADKVISNNKELEEKQIVKRSTQIRPPSSGKSLMNLDPKFVDLFKMSVENSCRCRFDLNVNLPKTIASAYYRFVSEKHSYYQFKFDPSGTLRSIVSVALVAQILNTIGGDKRRSLTNLNKMTELDVHVPVLLGALIKTVGDFDCEYGKFEINHVIHYVLSVLCLAYQSEKNGFEIKQFDACDFNSVFPLPWASEGFDYFKEIAVDHLKTVTRSIAGIHVSIPLPEPELTLDTYVQSLDGWSDRMNEIRPAAQLYYLDRKNYQPEIKLGEKTFKMIDAKTMLDVVFWTNSIIEKYKTKVQPFLIQLGSCAKFAPTAEGNSCQLIRRQGSEIQSSFLVLEDDATIGAMFNYNTKTEIVGDFEGLLIQNIQAEKVKSVINGLERRITT